MSYTYMAAFLILDVVLAFPDGKWGLPDLTEGVLRYLGSLSVFNKVDIPMTAKAVHLKLIWQVQARA